MPYRKPIQNFTGKEFRLGVPKRGTLAGRLIKWIEQLPIVKSNHRQGQKLKLFKFQKQILKGIFPNDRSVRHAVVSMPRKCSKSSLAAYINLAHLYFPPLMTPGAQLLIISVAQKQASLIFRQIIHMIDLLPEHQRCKVSIRESEGLESITRNDLGIKLQVLAADNSAGRLVGYEPHLATIDEAAMMTSPMNYLSMKTANPKLILLISTVTALIEGENHWHSKLVYDNEYKPKHHYKYFLGATKEEADKRWDDPEVWKRVTPCLEIKSLDYIKGECEDAKRHGTINSFKWAHLNYIVPSLSDEVTIATQKEIDACYQPDKELPKHSRCVLGVDLAQITDCAALVLLDVFTGVTKSLIYVPQQALQESANMRDRYQEWNKEGWVVVVDDDYISYTTLAEQILKWMKDYKIVAICKDQHTANQFEIISKDVGVTIPQHNVVQKGKEINIATMGLKALIVGNELAINNPCTMWHLRSTRWSMDTYGSIRPHKQLSQARAKGRRIDATLALCNAVWYRQQHKVKKKTTGVYLGFLGEK